MPSNLDQNENKRFKKLFGMWVGSFGSAPDGSEKTSVDELAMLIGVKRNTVKSHLAHDGTMPTLATMKLYMKALPIGFSAAYFYDCGFEISEAHEHELLSGPELMSALAKQLSTLAKDLEDGDHSIAEKRALAPTMIVFGPIMTTLGHSWLSEPHLKEVG